jgi:hypothetical protein
MSARSDSSVATGSALVAKQVLFLFLGAWFAAAVLASAVGLFDSKGGPPLGLGLFVLLPTVGLLSAWRISPLLREAARSIPLWKLTFSHVLRLEGAMFVIDAARGKLPALFGYVAGIGDVIAALGAIPLALALAKGTRTPGLRARFAAWNVFGLIDLITAITLGILCSPTTVGILHHGGASTGSFGLLPTSLVPTFFVPAYVLTHLLAWKRRGEVA